MNMRPYNSDTAPLLHGIVHDQNIMPGSWVACLDDIDDKQYHIGKVLSVIDDNIRVHYFGTKSSNLMHAVSLPLWRSYPSQDITVTKPTNALDLDAQRLTGTWSLSIEFDNLIVIPNIGMTAGMRINAATPLINIRIC